MAHEVTLIPGDGTGLELAEATRGVDDLCNQLVSRPDEYVVVVLPDRYGDVVSDLGAGMIGGLGLAPGGNIGTEAASFEATHGSAPKYKGQNKVIRKGEKVTYDLKATRDDPNAVGTSKFADAVIEEMSR